MNKHVADDKNSNLFYEYPELVSSINKSINPCNDFYEFVCSGWKHNNPIEADKTSSNQFQLISNLIEKREKEILDNRQTFHSYPPYDKMMFNLYDSCLDIANSTGTPQRVYDIESVLLFEKHVPKHLFTCNFKTFLKFVNYINPNNVFLMSEKLYLEENMAPKYLEALKEYLTKLLELLYTDDSEQLIFKKLNKKEDISRRVNSFIQVELQMAKIINETDKHYDNAYADDEYLIIQKFQNNLAGSINWVRYLQNILPQQVLLQKYPDGVANVEARISEVTLIKKFDRLAQNLSGQVLSDYMDWKLILSEVTYLDDRFLDVGFELDRVLQGSVERPAHWKECKNVLINVFPALIERVTKIESAYRFTVIPGQPFAEAMDSLNILMNQKSMLQLLDPVEVEFSSLGINGFYYPIKNVIVLTGGILQGVFFNSTTRPMYEY
uniref:Peptidase M13 N-terminal domain-containing protein n=1 Tax=Meloidogyne javanica TaxID=6303 RepID=A0A915N8Z4_MELJA